MIRKRSWSIAARVFGVQLFAVLAIGAVLLIVLGIDARRAADEDAASTSLAVALTIVADPAVTQALRSEDPTVQLQPYAVRVMAAADVAFVTIMDPKGIRYTHPDPNEIGRPFLGTIEAAQRGENLVETYTGTLGPSVRAVVPVLDDGELVGIVSAGVTTQSVAASLLPRIPFIIALAIAVVALGSVAAALTSRSLRRTTGSLAPDQLTSMVEFYESVLHSVREGVVLTDGKRRVVLYNDEAAELLALPPAEDAPPAATAGELGVPPAIAALLDSGRRVVEETHLAGDRVLLVNQEPAVTTRDAAPSAVMTVRDQSRLQQLVGELESVRSMSEALRAQAHDHANTLHTIVSLLELGRVEEARTLVAESSRISQGLTDAVVDATADPVLSALLLGKAAHASERGIAFGFEVDPAVSLPLSAAETVSLVGNLLDNALDAAASGDAPREVGLGIRGEDTTVVLTVRDSGRGIPAEDLEHVFDLGFTSKSADRAAHGVGLTVALRVAHAHGGTITITRDRQTEFTVRLPRAVES